MHDVSVRLLPAKVPRHRGRPMTSSVATNKDNALLVQLESTFFQSKVETWRLSHSLSDAKIWIFPRRTPLRLWCTQIITNVHQQFVCEPSRENAFQYLILFSRFSSISFAKTDSHHRVAS